MASTTAPKKRVHVEPDVCCTPLTQAALGEDEAAELAGLMGAMADPVRLRLLSIIAASGEVCSCNLEEPLGRSQPTISHHTRLLSEAGLITGEKRGKWIWWRIVPERLATVRRFVSGA